ncbi:cbb3-type cytochrome oxidase assembly protein CcoS [bacterium]|nr:cbb3-type cytochrome oxidase assembly protein CcoS [bacterium]
MSVVYIALPIALVLATLAIIAFVWSVKQGQYDDLETPAVRILQEDLPQKPKEEDEQD